MEKKILMEETNLTEVRTTAKEYMIHLSQIEKRILYQLFLGTKEKAKIYALIMREEKVPEIVFNQGINNLVMVQEIIKETPKKNLKFKKSPELNKELFELIKNELY